VARPFTIDHAGINGSSIAKTLINGEIVSATALKFNQVQWISILKGAATVEALSARAFIRLRIGGYRLGTPRWEPSTT